MKKIIFFICSFICYLLFIPSLMGIIIGGSWYLLPACQETTLGTMLLNALGTDGIMWATIGCGIGTVIFFIFGKVFTVIKNSKALNFYTHIVSWLLTILIIALIGYTFAVSETMIAASFALNAFRRGGILICAGLMFLYSMFHKKFGKLIDRKLQAYDTAKELNADGRSSVVWVNILKTLDFVLPELILFILICFCFNLDIAKYFIVIACSFFIPIVGNMICDKRVKIEARRKKEEERETLVNEVANAVVDAQRHNP